MKIHSPNRQRGVTLLVGLVMLVLMTLLAISAFNLGRGNLQIVGNMQNRNDNYNAAKEALEEIISKTNFTVYPPIPLFANGSNTKDYDVNGDGVADVSVTIGSTKDPAKPTCVSANVIQNANLNPLQSDAAKAKADAQCMANLQQNLGQTGPALICAGIIGQIAAGADQATLQQLQAQSTDLGCPALIAAAPGSSLCADTIWDIQATARDPVTQARVVGNIGVKVRAPSANVTVACP